MITHLRVEFLTSKTTPPRVIPTSKHMGTSQSRVARNMNLPCDAQTYYYCYCCYYYFYCYCCYCYR